MTKRDALTIITEALKAMDQEDSPIYIFDYDEIKLIEKALLENW